MAKKVVFDVTGWEKKHNKSQNAYAKEVDKLYSNLAVEVSQLIASIPTHDKNEPFSFSDYPSVNNKVDKLVKSLSSNLTLLIQDGSQQEWLKACEKNDQLVQRILSSISPNQKIDDERYYQRNLEGLAAFQRRKENGLNLSERVWKLTQQTKDELELCFDIGLFDGRSASELSRDVRDFLREPNRLFHRVKDKYGNLKLSKNAKAYHPGQGVYRSSAKNALRLARTEINMAYRSSDIARWEQLDFVVGYEVKRSNNPYPCSVCESLAGKYPKNFVFTGWHPHCRCYIVAILASPNEFAEYQNKLIAGEDVSDFHFSNEVHDLPDGFTKWVQDNSSKIENAKSLPYFLKDNFKKENIVDQTQKWNVDKKANIGQANVPAIVPELSEAEIKQIKFMEYEQQYAKKKLQQADELGITGKEYDDLVAALNDGSLTYSQIATKSNKLLKKIKAAKTALDDPFSQAALEKSFSKDEVKSLLDAYNKHLAKKEQKSESDYVSYLKYEIDWIKTHSLTKYNTAPKLVEMLEHELKVIQEAEAAKTAEAMKKLKKSLKPTKGTLEEFYTKEELAKVRMLENEVAELRIKGEHSWDWSVMEKQNQINDIKKELSYKYHGKAAKLKHLDNLSDKEFNDLLKEYLSSNHYSGGVSRENIQKLSRLTGLSEAELSLPIKYTSNYAFSLNSRLRSTPTKADKTFATLNNRILEKMPRFEGVLRRGLNKDVVLDELLAAQKGNKLWRDKGFVSTALRGSGFSGDLKLTIHARSGAILEDISVYGKGEAEVLLRAGSKFKVISIEKKGYTWYAELEEVL